MFVNTMMWCQMVLGVTHTHALTHPDPGTPVWPNRLNRET